jgi:hypothetical protein
MLGTLRHLSNRRKRTREGSVNVLHDAFESTEASSFGRPGLLLILVFLFADVLGTTYEMLVLTVHQGKTIDLPRP